MVTAFGFGRRLGVLALLLVGVIYVHSASAAVLDFEDLVLGTEYHVGDTFTTAGVPITGEAFWPSVGDPVAGGFARVVDDGMADGAGNELAVNNINLSFDFGGPIAGLSLQYGEYGGNLNININGDFVNFGNFTDIDNTTIGGTAIFTQDSGAAGNSSGALFVIGTIDSFAIGGQELWIDNMVTSCVPEPATVALLGLGGLFASVCRRRPRTR